MSQIILSADGLVISRWLGPENAEGRHERRWTMAVVGSLGNRVTLDLSAEQWERLGDLFAYDCSVECDGPHLRCDKFCRHPGKEPNS